jgi:hypothetical protein
MRWTSSRYTQDSSRLPYRFSATPMCRVNPALRDGHLLRNIRNCFCGPLTRLTLVAIRRRWSPRRESMASSPSSCVQASRAVEHLLDGSIRDHHSPAETDVPKAACQHEQRRQSRIALLGSGHYRSNRLDGRSLHPALPDLGRPGSFGNILADPSPPDRLMQGGRDDGVMIADGLRGAPLLLHDPIQVVKVTGADSADLESAQRRPDGLVDLRAVGAQGCGDRSSAHTPRDRSRAAD